MAGYVGYRPLNAIRTAAVDPERPVSLSQEHFGGQQEMLAVQCEAP